MKANVSLSQFSWKAVPQLQTCSCKTPVSIVVVGPSDYPRLCVLCVARRKTKTQLKKKRSISTVTQDIQQHPPRVSASILLLLLLWQSPLGLRSAKRRHRSPERMIPSHVNCFIQGEVVGFQVLLDSLHPRSTRASSSSQRGSF